MRHCTPAQDGIYTQSILHGSDAGSIRYLRPADAARFGPPDPYSHLAQKHVPYSTFPARISQIASLQRRSQRTRSGLESCNTRHLSPLGTAAIKHIRETAGQRTRQLFFFGPGAGVECCDAATIDPDATIHSNALTPMSPTMELTLSFAEIQQKAPEICSGATILNIDAVCDTDQKQELGIFRMISKKSPERVQWIGPFDEFLTQSGKQDNPYDFIYEMHGPLQKNLGVGESIERSGTILRNLEKMLGINSILMLGFACGPVQRILAQLHNFQQRTFGRSLLCWHANGPHDEWARKL